MKLTEKMKKNLAILGGVLIGIGLIAAIGMQFGSKPSGKDVLPGTGETETELIVDPGDFEKKEEESKVVSREEESLVIHQGIGENQETDTQAVDSRAPQTDQTTQSIQPKPTKPEPPSKEILTDPTQKPDGTKQDTPPVPVDHEAVRTGSRSGTAAGRRYFREPDLCSRIRLGRKPWRRRLWNCSRRYV